MRDFTASWFKNAGYKLTDSQVNFLFVEIRRPCREFRDACRQRGVLVARDFPPCDKTRCRISLGTMDEMRRATDVFSQVLSRPAATAAA